MKFISKINSEIRPIPEIKIRNQYIKFKFRDRIFCLIRKWNHSKIENGIRAIRQIRDVIQKNQDDIEGISTWRHHQIKWRTFLKMSEPSPNAGSSRQAHWTDTERTHLKRRTEQNHWINTANRHSTQIEKMSRSSEWTQLTSTVDRNSGDKQWTDTKNRLI